MKPSALLLLILAVANCSQAQIGSEFDTDILTSNTFITSSFVNDNAGWLADDAGKLWYTTNGGETWISSLTEKNFLKLQFADELIGFGITAEAAWKTTDGGISWSNLPLPSAVGMSLYFLDVNTGFISGNQVIYKTTNGGQSWTSISIEGMYFLDYFFIDAATGIAAAYDTDSTRSILRTTNGGLDWDYVYAEEDFFMNAVWMTEENTAWSAGYFASGARGDYPALLRSDDGGITWENVYLNSETGNRKGEKFIDIRFRNELQGFALSEYTESIYTTDGGQTWHLLYDESGTSFIPDWGIYQALDGINDMYLLGKNGYVTKWE